METDYISWVGYIASGVVLLSFLFKNMTRLRILNSLGCSIFVYYGILLDSIPVIVTNLGILFINAYYLLKPIVAGKQEQKS